MIAKWFGRDEQRPTLLGKLRKDVALRERLYNTIWSIGVRVRNVIKHAGLLGPVDGLLAYLGPRLFAPPTHEVEICLPSGMKMIVPPGMPSYRNFASGLYEVAVTNVMRSFLAQGMTMIDLGANIGYYTLLASGLVGRSGRVYAFEPEPEMYECLVRNIVANGCENVVAVEKAVSDRAETAQFVRLQLERGYLMNSSAFLESCRSIQVDTITLDDFFASEGWPPVDFVKIDIEGGEEAALRGMRDLSQRNPAMRLIMEINLDALRRVGTAPEALAAAVRELGFTNGHVIERRMKPFLVAKGLPTSRGVHNVLLERT